jgi:hypothetical protein
MNMFMLSFLTNAASGLYFGAQWGGAWESLGAGGGAIGGLLLGLVCWFFTLLPLIGLGHVEHQQIKAQEAKEKTLPPVTQYALNFLSISLMLTSPFATFVVLMLVSLTL